MLKLEFLAAFAAIAETGSITGMMQAVDRRSRDLRPAQGRRFGR
jgi:hypothetical protein